MNVVIYNQQDNIINGLNIEISKAIKGEFKVEDIIKTFCKKEVDISLSASFFSLKNSSKEGRTKWTNRQKTKKTNY